MRYIRASAKLDDSDRATGCHQARVGKPRLARTRGAIWPIARS